MIQLNRMYDDTEFPFRVINIYKERQQWIAIIDTLMEGEEAERNYIFTVENFRPILSA